MTPEELCTSHPIGAEVQLLVEMVVVEVTSPNMTRPKNPPLYDVPTPTLDPQSKYLENRWGSPPGPEGEEFRARDFLER